MIHFFIHGVSENASALSDAMEETDSSVSKVVVALNQLVGNKEMYLVLGIFYHYDTHCLCGEKA